MAKTHTKFVCQACGYESPKWIGRCPDCNAWASLVEEIVTVESPSKQSAVRSGAYATPTPITELQAGGARRTSSGISEFDRALGGGVVEGSLVLIGGDPGIGKSTILIQVASHLSKAAGRVLYISGEESAEQIKLRSERIGISSPDLLVVSETDIQAVEHYVQTVSPQYVVIDSIQTMYDPELSSAPGTVSQVRSCTAALARVAKTGGIPIFIVGHVTKEGAIAGPRVLEHMVDTVLYFEGERHQSYRVLRAVKNRFGSTDELGIFEMREEGLMEVLNPSEVLLAERPEGGSGSVVTSTIEGSRPILVEIQALVAPSYFTSPRRTCTGIDYNKMLMILAVLEKRVGLNLGNKDVYVNVAGGVKIVEPAADLAIALAVASSLSDIGMDPEAIALGEIGLAGEVRAVGQAEKRLKEAARLGFTKGIMSYSTGKLSKGLNIEPVRVPTVRGAIEAAFSSMKNAKQSG
ncbi:MAG: DNA repair protein RadA [Armatimonadetes bacterium]|nr:DNA repair protein RadA [Armatimonadota bacterium]